MVGRMGESLSPRGLLAKGCASGMMVAFMLFSHFTLTSQASLWPNAPGARLTSNAPSGSAPIGGVMRLRGGKTGGIKARDIWTKPLDELSQMEEDLRLELMASTVRCFHLEMRFV